MSIPALWLARASSLLRQRERSLEVLRLRSDGVLSSGLCLLPCPPPVVRHCELAGLSAVGERVWRRCYECTASCSCVSSALQWMQFGVWGWPPAIDWYNCAGVWVSVPLRSRWRLDLAELRPRFGSQTTLFSYWRRSGPIFKVMGVVLL
jgi:hypothetical protein